MRHGRLAPFLIYPALLVAVAPGCQVFYSYRPVAVLARDAETKQPIPGAEISLTYPLTSSSRSPWESSETTGDDGVAHLRAVPNGDAILVKATAKSYLSEEKDLPIKVVEALEPAHPFERVAQRPVSFVVELYAEPHPTVELVVPNLYRGLVKAEVTVQDDAPCPPGQRCFSFVVPLSGEVHVIGPSLLRRVFPPDFLAKYADGTPLTCDAKGVQVGFRYLKREDPFLYFVVGTVFEFENYRRTCEKEEAGASRPSGSGKGEGRGRRGRRGTQTPADASPGGMTPGD